MTNSTRTTLAMDVAMMEVIKRGVSSGFVDQPGVDRLAKLKRGVDGRVDSQKVPASALKAEGRSILKTLMLMEDKEELEAESAAEAAKGYDWSFRIGEPSMKSLKMASMGSPMTMLNEDTPLYSAEEIAAATMCDDVTDTDCGKGCPEWNTERILTPGRREIEEQYLRDQNPLFSKAGVKQLHFLLSKSGESSLTIKSGTRSSIQKVHVKRDVSNRMLRGKVQGEKDCFLFGDYKLTVGQLNPEIEMTCGLNGDFNENNELVNLFALVMYCDDVIFATLKRKSNVPIDSTGNGDADGRHAVGQLIAEVAEESTIPINWLPAAKAALDATFKIIW
uniref:Nonstructural protein n=1 Tax=Chum salmon influenza-like virus TaxID=2777032 RepID=A0A866VZZ2_9ORTO|nr:nonstructural protein [Chum salmon influenza-like virus]